MDDGGMINYVITDSLTILSHFIYEFAHGKCFTFLQENDIAKRKKSTAI